MKTIKGIAKCPYCKKAFVSNQPEVKHICKPLMNDISMGNKEDILNNSPNLYNDLPIMEFTAELIKPLPINS